MSDYTVQVVKDKALYCITIEDDISTWTIERSDEDFDIVCEKLIRRAATMSDSYYKAVKQACVLCMQKKSDGVSLSVTRVEKFIKFMLSILAASMNEEALSKLDKDTVKAFRKFCKRIETFLRPSSKLSSPTAQLQSKLVSLNISQTQIFTIKEDEIIEAC